MGKQLNIYLPEETAKRLRELAVRECRNPPQQALYLLLRVLDNDEVANTVTPMHNRADEVLADDGAVAT